MEMCGGGNRFCAVLAVQKTDMDLEGVEGVGFSLKRSNPTGNVVFSKFIEIVGTHSNMLAVQETIPATEGFPSEKILESKERSHLGFQIFRKCLHLSFYSYRNISEKSKDFALEQLVHILQK
jgi:hypothetical protein